MLLTVGLRGTPFLCILGSLCSLRGLEPAGRSCLHKYSVSVGFLKQYCVFWILSTRWHTWSAIYRMDPQKGK